MTSVWILALSLRVCAAIVSIVLLFENRNACFRLMEQGGAVAWLLLLAIFLAAIVFPITVWVKAPRIATRLQYSRTSPAIVSVDGGSFVQWGCVVLGIYILGSTMPTVLGKIALLTTQPLPDFLWWGIAWSTVSEGATVALGALLLLHSGWIARRICRTRRSEDATCV